MHIHNLDFHYHAGQERHPGSTVRDFIEHARMTGRLVLGVTDHLQFYIEPSRIREGFPYPQSFAGLVQYREELEALKPEFPTMRLLFGPEIPANGDLARVPQEVIAMSDYFICEYPFLRASIAENTDALVNRIRQVRDFVEANGKPTYIAHPFRDPVNRRMVKANIEPWLTELAPRVDGNFSNDELNEFFRLDIERVGKASRENGVPLEINGNTDLRVRSSNIPAAVQMLWAAKRTLHEQGASFVPGSDQHKYIGGNNNRMGGYVPFETFAKLGLTAADITFLDALGLAA